MSRGATFLLGLLLVAATPAFAQDAEAPAPMEDMMEVGECGCTSARLAGYSGNFQGFSHGVQGFVEMIDDCTIMVSDWGYDGLGPLVRLWGAPLREDNAVFDYNNGQQLVDLEFPVGDGTGSFMWCLDGPIPEGQTHLSVWCETFRVDFGNSVLTAPSDADSA